MDIRLDPTKDGQAVTAVLLSHMILSIALQCPDVDISLTFTRCKCSATPVSNFAQECFPRVKQLTMYLGQYDVEETHASRREFCSKDLRFWSPFVDGKAFPDLTGLEIRHFWRTEPGMPPLRCAHRVSLAIPQRVMSGESAPVLQHIKVLITEADANGYVGPSTSLDLADFRSWSNLPDIWRAKHSAGRQDHHTEVMLSLAGLECLEKIKLEYVPELDAPVLMQLLGNPKVSLSRLNKIRHLSCGRVPKHSLLNLFHEPITMLMCQHL